jgi:hypothetical protein
MEILNYKTFREIVDSNIPIELKIHIFESDISELIYGLWCRITGGKFERRQIDRQNSCVLVTKRGFHIISTVVGLLNRIQFPARKLKCINATVLVQNLLQYPELCIGIGGTNTLNQKKPNAKNAEDRMKCKTMTGKLLGNFKENYEANSNSSWRIQFYDFD